ncbi:hypothetical protein ACTA71_010633 [Dictyostelium dimigraforme]
MFSHSSNICKHIGAPKTIEDKKLNKGIFDEFNLTDNKCFPNININVYNRKFNHPSTIYFGNVIIHETQSTQSNNVAFSNVIGSSFTSIFNFEVGTFRFNKIIFQNCILSSLFYFNLIFGKLNLLVKLI